MVEPEDRHKITITRSFLLTLVAAGFALGVLVGAGMRLFSPLQPMRTAGQSDLSGGSFMFIRPPVQMKDPADRQRGRELKPFRYKVNEAIERMTKEGAAESISLYFRDLHDGNRFGIGDRDKLLAADHLKIPLMMAYFKWSETSPVVLRKVIPYAGTVRAAGQLEPGKTYTVSDLIFRMIVNNDDAAYELLAANIQRLHLEKIYKELYTDYDPQRPDDHLSLSAYASFFRVLFNASYLSEEMSEKALRYLSRSAPHTAMSTGIPVGIVLSGKRGEQEIRMSDDEEALPQYRIHELGVVYHPVRPFVLGFAVRGGDLEHINKILRNLTRLVYEEVDQQSQESS